MKAMDKEAYEIKKDGMTRAERRVQAYAGETK